MKLTKTQRQAIERPGGNLQLIACAGSGKTEVVAGPTAGEERIRTPGAMRVSSLPKAAQNWALFVTHQIAINKRRECRFLFARASMVAAPVRSAPW